MGKLRVAFAGASGTGKSTLAEWLAAEAGLELCPVGARSVAAEMGFASPYDVDASGRRAEFQARLFEAKRGWEADHEAFVTDRTVLDNLAYLTMHGGARGLSMADLDAYQASARRYTHVFVCPMSAFWSVGDDPQRVRELPYQLLYEAVLQGLTHERVDYVVLHAADLESRKAVVRQKVLANMLGLT